MVESEVNVHHARTVRTSEVYHRVAVACVLYFIQLVLGIRIVQRRIPHIERVVLFFEIGIGIKCEQVKFVAYGKPETSGTFEIIRIVHLRSGI